ncbi:MAG: ribbon-helix-helix protein, CopG family [Rhodoblastus sp.]|nr:ribbon-helix-helix protein, CopG family [Rhodoblastus sp.]
MLDESARRVSICVVMQQSSTTGLRLPAEMRVALDTLAAAEGRSLGNLIRAMLRAELERRGVPVQPAAPRAGTPSTREATQ